MPDLNAIETAFGQRLASPQILPIVWPNKAASPSKPYLSVQHVPTSRDSNALAGGGVVEAGYFVVTVVAESNTFATAANGKADEVADRFPMALKMACGSRWLRVSRPAQMLQPFPNGADWRQPVRVDYIVTAR